MEYTLLFAWTFLSASIVPFSSEPYFIGLVVTKQIILIPLIIASLGNTLGGITTFWIGRKTGIIATHKFSAKKQKQFTKAQNTIAKYGAFAMILSWIPFIGDIIVLAGGVFKLPYGKSIFWMIIGKTSRYYILALIALGFF